MSSVRAVSPGHRFGRIVAATVVVVFAIVPLLWVLLSSLQPLENLLGSALNAFRFDQLSWGGYEDLMASGFVQWAFNSLLVTTVVALANIVFDCLAAYPLARMKFRGNSLVFALILAGIMIPAQVIIVPLYVQMRDLGLLDTYWALILPYLVSPTGIFLMRQHYSTLPRELEEASSVDGAGPWRTFVSVILPNSKAMIGTVFTLKFLWTWGEFAWPSLAVNSNALKTIPVGLAGFQGQFLTNWPALMAGSVLAVIPPILLFLILQRWFTEGLTAGAVKG